MPASDRVTGPAQILRQILFHLGGGLIRHRVQVLIQFRQKAEAVAFDHRGCFGSRLMVGETFLRGQPCHPNVDAGFLGIALRVFGTNFSHFADRRLKQHDVNIVMVLRQLAGAESLERSTLHSASIGKSGSSSSNLN